MNCKGLIYALGRWSQAYLPLTVTGSYTERVDDIPRVCFTIEMMAAAGIKKILIAATPENLIRHREVVRQFTNLEADLSYLVLDEDAGISRSIVAASEFAAQSNLLIANAGIYCEGEGLSSRLATAVLRSKGVTAFRMRGSLCMEGEFLPHILVLDSRVRGNLREEDPEQLNEVPALRKYCSINFRYSECDFGDGCYFVDLIDCSEVEESFVAYAVPRIRQT